MPVLAVIGSLNVDLTVTTQRFHQPGETITGSTFCTYPGGKGGNQAVAAARLGACVHMVSALGEDDNGAFYQRTLQAEGIHAQTVMEKGGVPTGVALIQVDNQGENRIVVVPGANAQVNSACVDEALPHIAHADMALLQLEIPMDTVLYAAQALHRQGIPVMLDPAPAQPLPDSLYPLLSYITPNRSELHLLTGLPTDSLDQVKKTARQLLRRGARAVVAKLGAAGCLYMDEQRCLPVPGFAVQVVDTTAAGDSFNAGLAYALAEGQPMEQALRFANAVGALSTTKAGAQAAMPTLAQVQALLTSTGSP
jgi:ribokinase